MTASILAILGALIPFIIWLIRRKLADKDSVTTQYENAVQENNDIIVKGDANALNIKLQSELNKLRISTDSNKSR